MNAISGISVSRSGKINGMGNPIDVHVGSRIRLRRTLLGMSQEQLGAAIGLTFQQVQKYERGANRIGASRLYDLTRVLNVPMSFFFDDMPEEVSACSPMRLASGLVDEPPVSPDADATSNRANLEMTRLYGRLPATVQTRLRQLMAALADQDGEN